MTRAQSYDLEIVSGERYDRVFKYKTADGAAMSLSAWTPVMIIFLNGDTLYTSLGADPDIKLTKEPAGETGRIDLLLPYDFTQQMLQPIGTENYYSYRLDLVDNSLSTNVVPLLYGYVNVTRRFGQ